VGDERGSARAGLIYGLAAYAIWGVIPLYFRAVDGVSSTELLAQRIVWSVLLLALVITCLGRWSDLVGTIRAPRMLPLLTASAFLLAANWLIYIQSVASRQVVQASLGYFMLPLFSVFLGLVFLRERLRGPQWVAIGFAAASIGYLLWTVDEIPWYALGVAVSFGLYGLVRKLTQVDGLSAVTVETLVLVPAALACLLWWGAKGSLVFGTRGRVLDVLIVSSGVVTAVPLLFFAGAARRLPLSTLGFLQYVGPTVSLLIAVALFGETEKWDQQKPCFILVWVGLAVLALESVLRSRAVVPPPPAPVPKGQQAATCPD
jgi:chloramphenicol-sensitive protein RarD